MKELLPIGSVVLLKQAEKRIMIIGYYPTMIDNNSEITYDYSACYFPEGIMDVKSSLLFNHDQIEKVLYIGLSDEEQKKFVNMLNETVLEEESVGSSAAVSSGQPVVSDFNINI